MTNAALCHNRDGHGVKDFLNDLHTCSSPAADALRIYRSKDAVEKLFHSLKSEIKIKPVRVWSEDAVYGVLFLGFIAQMMICLTRHFVEPARAMSTKFIAGRQTYA